MTPPRQSPSSHALAAWLAVPVEHTADFDTLAQVIAALLGAPVVLISTLERGQHSFVGTFGVEAGAADDVSPLCLEVVTLERPVLMQDARRHLAADTVTAHGAPLASYMGLPIIAADGTCFGAVSVFREEHHCWHGRDLMMLRGFVGLLAAQFAEHRARRQSPYARHPSQAHEAAKNGLFMLSDDRAPRAIRFRALGMRDELTGLVDRRGFMVIGQRQLALAREAGRAVSIVCVAVDGPREQLVCATADLLRRHFHAADLVARVDSDVFLIAITDAGERDIAACTLALAAELERMPAWTWTVSLRSDDCAELTIDALATTALDRMQHARHPREPKD